jgi:hypothetical protein
MRQAVGVLRRYRALGADLPFADQRRAHGRGLEGYFWRFSDAGSGQVVVALCGVCRDPTGASWATVAIAGSPGGFHRHADVPVAEADSHRLGVRAGEGGAVLRADADGVAVELGGDTRLDVRLSARREWARPGLGGVGAAHLVPGLGQYWHPYLFGAEVRGAAVLGGEAVSLDGWTVYAEHTWGAGGFPPRWWWGQSQGFERPDVCVAFAGGDVEIGPTSVQASSVVVALGDQVLRLGNPLLAPVHVEADGSTWQVHGRGPLWGVQLEGEARLENAHRLPVPLPRERRSVPGALEHLSAGVRLIVRRRGRVVYAGESAVGGLEIGGFGAAVPAGPVGSEPAARG